mmetsp:Transcript_94739/g.277123  ORF Transcript_94739/g.277123 Transcript_94739/m.277123 type:complete len:339 (-) Transcript_94739:118-1134(-)
MADGCKSLSVRLCTEGTDGKQEQSVPLEVNALEGIPFESPGFRGQVLLLNRPDPEEPSWPYYKHFQDKMRRFEFRLQGVFLVEPGDDIFFGVELTEAAPLGPALRMTANWILGVVSLLCSARGVSYSYNLELQELPNGDVLRPHLAFPIVAADAILATPSGERPPPLTEAIAAMPLQERQKVRLNTQDTFTFAYWSKQADFERWKICNMPFGWSSSFTNFIGQQQVQLTAYRLPREGDAECPPHSEARKKRLMSLVLANSRASREVEAVRVAGPTSAHRWSLEAAEMSSEELDRLWFVEDRAKPDSDSGNSPSSFFSWPWYLFSGAMCTCTTYRHSVR